MKVKKYIYNPNKAGVFRVSVVENPAVGEGDLVLMSADLEDYDLILNNEDRFRDLIDGKPVEMSSQNIKGIFYAPVMIPDLNIQRIDEKTDEKYLVHYDADTIEQLMNNYWKQCGNKGTNLEHETDNTEGVYPVESWQVVDPETDKSKALGMPLQKAGTWIMGYKADNPEVLEKVKNNLLQGLSIEGHLDTVDDEENPIAKFNKQEMEKKKTALESFKDSFVTLMSALGIEDKEKEETPAEESTETPEKEKEEDAEKMADETPPATDELATAKATIVELEKKNADLEAELATYKNEATLMSSQMKEVEKAFESYKVVQMSSQKLGDQPSEKPVLTAMDVKHAQFLKDAEAKL